VWISPEKLVPDELVEPLHLPLDVGEVDPLSSFTYLGAPPEPSRATERAPEPRLFQSAAVDTPSEETPVNQTTGVETSQSAAKERRPLRLREGKGLFALLRLLWDVSDREEPWQVELTEGPVTRLAGRGPRLTTLIGPGLEASVSGLAAHRRLRHARMAALVRLVRLDGQDFRLVAPTEKGTEPAFERGLPALLLETLRRGLVVADLPQRFALRGVRVGPGASRILLRGELEPELRAWLVREDVVLLPRLASELRPEDGIAGVLTLLVALGGVEPLE
jgi:hypothetical protein